MNSLKCNQLNYNLSFILLNINLNSQIMIKTSTLSAQNLAPNSHYQSDQKKQGFQLIWYYWYLKNVVNKPTKITTPSKQTKKISSPVKQTLNSISDQSVCTQAKKPITLQSIKTLLLPFRQTYHLQTIQTHLQHNLNAIKQRALLSRNDRFFVIEPEQQIQQIENQIRGSSINLKNDIELQTCLQDMLIQLYSYYLNSKNVYLIYKGTVQGSLLSHHYENNSISSSIDSTQNRLKMILTHNSSQSRLNTSKDSKGSLKNHERNQCRSYGSLKSSLVMPANTNGKLLQEDSILMLGHNGVESFVGEGDKMENKIQDMEVIDKLGEFDGLELWNIKYKKIPHTFIKFKKQSWTKCINLPLMHPSSPKTINQFSILPRISKLNPSIDKLLPFVSFIKLLEQYFPNLLPSIDSIFQYNSLPYVFLQQDNGYGSWKWQTNIGVLCYFMVYGNDEETLSIKKVERWVEQNPNTLLATTIKEMNKRQKEKNKKRKQLIKNLSVGNSTNNNNSNPKPTDSTLVNSSLQMLITRDENSDLAIW